MVSVEYDSARDKFYLKVFPNNDVIYSLTFDEIDDLQKLIVGEITKRRNIRLREIRLNKRPEVNT